MAFLLFRAGEYRQAGLICKKNIAILKRMPQRSSVCLIIALAVGVLACTTGTAFGAWQLVWSDEFNQPDGSSPDPTKWGYDIGNGSGGWGNKEWEYYTSRTNNARIQNGQLVIEADMESYSNFTGIP